MSVEKSSQVEVEHERISLHETRVALGGEPERLPSPQVVGTLDTLDFAEPTVALRGAASAVPAETVMHASLIAGRYEVLGMLGVGGMGRVYRVRDRELDEVVALKMLRHELVSSELAVERFRREVKLARRVTHPNVARTFDIGEHEGEKFLTMEYVDGTSLGQVLHQEGALPPRRALALATAICEGLAAAHDAGIVHRDLKPDNILVRRDGGVAISDFGIAHSFVGNVETTMLTVGTPAYMAPEQVQGRELDHRADVYALGAILYELLTGRRAWEGDHALAVAAARLTEPVPDPRRLRPGVCDPLAEVVQRCLARSPAERYGSVREVLEALRATRDEVAGRSEELPVLDARARADAACICPDGAWQRMGIKTVAVVPFESAEGDVFLAEGLTEDVIDTLSMASGLRVRPMGVVAQQAAAGRTAQELGRALEVAVVVTGSLRRIGDQVQIRTRAISVEDGFQLWARRLSCAVSELLSVSDEVAASVADALMVKQEVAPSAHPRPDDTGAVELYLRARYLLRLNWHLDLSEPIQLFEEALKRAPGDARMLSGAAVARARLGFLGAPSVEVFAESRRLAEAAMAAAPDRSEPHFAMAMVEVNEGAPRAAIPHLEQAIALSPGSADAHDLLGRVLSEVGPVERAIEHLQTALVLDPTIESARWDLMRAFALVGDWSQVDTQLAQGASDDYTLWVRALMRTRLDTWRPEPAWQDAPLPTTASQTLSLMVGIYREALSTRTVSPLSYTFFDQTIQLAANAPRRRPLMYQMIAELAALCGDTERCLDALEGGLEAGLQDRMWLLRCPLLDVVRAEPRFEAVARCLSGS